MNSQDQHSNPLDEEIPDATRLSRVLGENVHYLREKQDINVAKFAQMVGCSRPFVYKVERGEANPSLKAITELADALDVSVIKLLTPRYQRLDGAKEARDKERQQGQGSRQTKRSWGTHQAAPHANPLDPKRKHL